MRWVRTASAIVLFTMPACVLKLDHKNDPLPNGNVSGAPADCSQVTPVGTGGPSGPAATKFVGRFDTSDPSKAAFDWSGNEISARFRGTSVLVTFQAGAPVLFAAVVDDRPPLYFKAEVNRTTAYVIADGLPEGEHEVTLHRNSEALYTQIAFTGFTFPGGTILPQTVRPRRIEIIGDSITCGYGDAGTNATCPFDIPDDQDPTQHVPTSENNYLAYGSLAGRTLSADVVTLCYSGKGIYQNYREGVLGESTGINDPAAPTTSPDPDGKTLMPQYYQRTIASDPNSAAWDFTKEPEPQVVVINLGTNDFARDLNADSIADGIDLTLFHDKYTDFVSFVRSKRPNAHIFLTVSPMVSDKFPLDNARSNFRDILYTMAAEFDARGDHKVYALEFLEMGSRYGLGCDYHPNLTVHQIMSDQLVGAIRSKLCW